MCLAVFTVKMYFSCFWNLFYCNLSARVDCLPICINPSCLHTAQFWFLHNCCVGLMSFVQRPTLGMLPVFALLCTNQHSFSHSCAWNGSVNFGNPAGAVSSVVLCVSGLLDRATLLSCHRVSKHWRFLAEEVQEEIETKRMVENQAMIMQVQWSGS